MWSSRERRDPARSRQRGLRCRASADPIAHRQRRRGGGERTEEAPKTPTTRNEKCAYIRRHFLSWPSSTAEPFGSTPLGEIWEALRATATPRPDIKAAACPDSEQFAARCASTSPFVETSQWHSRGTPLATRRPVGSLLPIPPV